MTLNTLIMTNASNTGILDDGLSLTLNGSTVTGSAIGAPLAPAVKAAALGSSAMR